MWTAVACAIAGIVLIGILADQAVVMRSWWWLAASALLATTALTIRTGPAIARRTLLALSVLSLFAGITTLRTLETRDDYLPRIMAQHTGANAQRAGTVVALEGIVTSPPRIADAPQGPLAPFIMQSPSYHTWLSVSRMQISDTWMPASGRVLIITRGSDAPTAQPGETVQTLGIYSPPRDRVNPGEPPRLRKATQDNYAGILESSSPTLVQRIEVARGWSKLTQLRELLRLRAREAFDAATRSTSPERRALARTLLLGNSDDPAVSDISQTFTKLGLSHVLSISGFHLTVMAMVALYVLRLTGDRGWIEPALVALAVLLYTSLVPLEAPIVRSALMVLALLATEATGRRYDRVCVLALITLALLAWRPLDATNLGFQLSVGLTAMLLWSSDAMQWRLFGKPIQGLIETRPTLLSRIIEGTKAATAIGVMCWLVSLPLLMHTTGLISPLGVLATLIVSPIIVVALWAGYISLALAAVSPWLAAPAAWTLTSATAASAWAARVIESVPMSSLRVADPGLLWTFAATTALIACARLGYAWRKRTLLLTLTAIAATYFIACSLPTRTHRNIALRINTLSVGDGTCMLLSSENDAILWDCKTAPRAGVLPGIVAAARAQGVSRVPRVIITHPDIDHFAGLFDIIEPLGVQQVLVPARFIDQASQEPAGAADITLRELARRGVLVRTLAVGDQLTIGTARGTILSPSPTATFTNDNDHSITMLVETPTSQPTPARILLNGDIGPAAIEALTTSTSLPPLDAAELPHHGSYNPQSEAMITQLSPRIVLQSTGPKRLDDPRWDVARANRTWLVTARDGAISLEIRRDGTLHTRTFAPTPADVR